jgi:hypothetical protein
MTMSQAQVSTSTVLAKSNSLRRRPSPTAASLSRKVPIDFPTAVTMADPVLFKMALISSYVRSTLTANISAAVTATLGVLLKYLQNRSYSRYQKNYYKLDHG